MDYVFPTATNMKNPYDESVFRVVNKSMRQKISFHGHQKQLLPLVVFVKESFSKTQHYNTAIPYFKRSVVSREVLEVAIVKSTTY